MPWYEKLYAIFKAWIRKTFAGKLAKFSDVDLRKLFRDALAGLKKNRTQEGTGNGEQNGETRFSANGNPGNSGNLGNSGSKGKQAYYLVPFAEGVQSAVDPKNRFEIEPVFVSFTTKPFEDIGLTRLPMMMMPRHLRLNYYNEKEFIDLYGRLHAEDHAHGLHDAILKLPDILKHPLMIVKNYADNAADDSVVALTEFPINGKRVIVPIKIEGIGRGYQKDIDAHIVLTVYEPNDWAAQFARRALDEEERGIPAVFYVNESAMQKRIAEEAKNKKPKKDTLSQRAMRLATKSRRHGALEPGVIHNITDVGINVKPQTKTLQFFEFFGDWIKNPDKSSQIVDDNGEPLVVFHGSDRDPLAQPVGQGTLQPNTMFTADPEYAKRYGKYVRAYYLNIRHPFDIRNSKEYEIFKQYRNGNEPAKTNSGAMDWAEYDYDDLMEYLEKRFPGHYDGAVLDEGGDPQPDGSVKSRGVSYVTFKEGQAKSATDNVGTFDKNNPDVRFKIEDFSDEDLKHLVDASKDFASKHYYDVKGDADFLEFYRRHNLPVDNEHDAHFIMTLALEEVRHEKRLVAAKKAAKSKKINEARAIKEFADENPLFAFMQSFVGNDFTINPGKRFEGTEFAGDYISPEFKKYGYKEARGKRTEKQYQAYLAQEKDIPLYLATAEAHQLLSPQMEAPDRVHNIHDDLDLSNFRMAIT